MKVELEITDATQYATAYVDGKPVATVARRRVDQKEGPIWQVYDMSGQRMYATLLNRTGVGLARIIARILTQREKAQRKTSERVQTATQTIGDKAQPLAARIAAHFKAHKKASVKERAAMHYGAIVALAEAGLIDAARDYAKSQNVQWERE